MGKLDELLSQGGATLDELARAGRDDGMTYDEISRKLVGAGRMKRTPSMAEALDIQQKDDLARADPEVLKMDPVERISARNRPTGEVTTGQQMWDANNGMSPHDDPAEQVSGGRYRQYVVDGEIVPGFLVDNENGDVLSTERVKARMTMELAAQ